LKGRKEMELETNWLQESRLGVTIRAWRRYRELSVTDLADRAGFGTNGRSYISKIEHGHIKHLGGKQLSSIAAALQITDTDLQDYRMPELEDEGLNKKNLDDAIQGCKALLKVYPRENRPLDWARTQFKLAEIYRDRAAFSKDTLEKNTILSEALQCIEDALSTFKKEDARHSYDEALQLRQNIAEATQQAERIKNLDDAIHGCKALLKVYPREYRPLDWARTQFRLAEIYRDRATFSKDTVEKNTILSEALQCIEDALSPFQKDARHSYDEALQLHQNIAEAIGQTKGYQSSC
jgi:transcriptional regulator with XRE-family HTH domain